MTRADDTELDTLAAQVRAFPQLDVEEVRTLLPAAADTGPAQARLVEHHLRIALDAALARGDRGIEVLDLYQEATLATIVAVAEYASRGGPPAGLRRYIERVVGAHLDDTIETLQLEQRADEAFVRDAQLYETAEIGLRRELARTPTTTELAAALEWPEERVAIVGDMLNAAREMYDADIAQYLDDEETDAAS